jgi:hypothetical protein
MKLQIRTERCNWHRLLFAPTRSHGTANRGNGIYSIGGDNEHTRQTRGSGPQVSIAPGTPAAGCPSATCQKRLGTRAWVH